MIDHKLGDIGLMQLEIPLETQTIYWQSGVEVERVNLKQEQEIHKNACKLLRESLT